MTLESVHVYLNTPTHNKDGHNSAQKAEEREAVKRKHDKIIPHASERDGSNSYLED